MGKLKGINRESTIRDIDNLFLTDDNTKIELFLKKAHDYKPVEQTTILQFLLTHLQGEKQIEIYSNITLSDYSIIQKNIIDYYLLVCCILFRKNIALKNQGGDQIYTEDWFSIFVNRLKSQQELYLRELNSNHAKDLKNRIFSSRNKTKNEEGLSFMVPCFDHLQEHGLDKSSYFYNSIKAKSPLDISVWFERLFSFNDLKLSLPSIFYDLSVVINELMQNTHDWARSTYDGLNEISPSVRACSVNIFLESKLSHENSAYDYIQEYIKQIYTSKREDIFSPKRQIKFDFANEKVCICEISVLDTGPGMASRWLRKDYKDISNKEELAAIIECFHKYFTSDNSSRTRLRGRGLLNVISIIGYSGLIRVRTGRCLIQRNFFKEKIESAELQKGEIDFKIVDNNLPLVSGTSISILYPFVYTSNVTQE